jgi:hypothetical protein
VGLLGGFQGWAARLFSNTFSGHFWFSGTTLLVMRDWAFYNPSNTATEGVVPFTCHPSSRLPKVIAAQSAIECLNIEFHFRISQEH